MTDLVEKVAFAIAEARRQSGAGGMPELYRPPTKQSVEAWKRTASIAIAAVLDDLERRADPAGYVDIVSVRRELGLSSPEKPQDARKDVSGYPWHKSG